MASQMTPRFSVSNFIAVINQTFDVAFAGAVEVEGEVVSFKSYPPKYAFFTLKDEDGSVNCFVGFSNLRTPIEDGMKVVVRAMPTLRDNGSFSLNIKDVRPLGEGNLRRSLNILKQKLATEGLFDVNRKRSLPLYPHRVAVISSTKAAGYVDFMKISRDRWGGAKFIVANVNVQGDGAADQIIRAISYFNQMAEPPEVIALIRGGGSAEDLAIFNDERLIRAVAGSRVPIITGIGHEVDESLCDLAADVRAATPSNVAQLLFPDKHELVRHLHFRLVGVKDEIQRAIDEQILRATMLQKDALEQWSSQVRDAINATLSQQKIIAEYDPEMALRRGYAMISGDLQVGSIVKITTKDIIMKARIESSERRNNN